jgi:hypothetical protein
MRQRAHGREGLLAVQELVGHGQRSAPANDFEPDGYGWLSMKLRE